MNADQLSNQLRKEGFRPYVIAQTLTGQEVELISYPYPDGGNVCILVRESIGDPTTMVEKLVKDLKIPVVKS